MYFENRHTKDKPVIDQANAHCALTQNEKSMYLF